MCDDDEIPGDGSVDDATIVQLLAAQLHTDLREVDDSAASLDVDAVVSREMAHVALSLADEFIAGQLPPLARAVLSDDELLFLRFALATLSSKSMGAGVIVAGGMVEERICDYWGDVATSWAERGASS